MKKKRHSEPFTYCYSEACHKALQSRQARFWKSTNSQTTEDQEHHAESECWLLCAVSTNVELGVQSSLFTLMQPCIQWQQCEDEETPASQQEDLKWLVWWFLGWMPGKTEAPSSSHLQEQPPHERLPQHKMETPLNSWANLNSLELQSPGTPRCFSVHWSTLVNREHKGTKFSFPRRWGRVQRDFCLFVSKRHWLPFPLTRLFLKSAQNSLFLPPKQNRILLVNFMWLHFQTTRREMTIRGGSNQNSPENRHRLTCLHFSLKRTPAESTTHPHAALLILLACQTGNLKWNKRCS